LRLHRARRSHRRNNGVVGRWGFSRGLFVQRCLVFGMFIKGGFRLTIAGKEGRRRKKKKKGKGEKKKAAVGRITGPCTGFTKHSQGVSAMFSRDAQKSLRGWRRPLNLQLRPRSMELIIDRHGARRAGPGALKGLRRGGKVLMDERGPGRRASTRGPTGRPKRGPAVPAVAVSASAPDRPDGRRGRAGLGCSPARHLCGARDLGTNNCRLLVGSGGQKTGDKASAGRRVSRASSRLGEGHSPARALLERSRDMGGARVDRRFGRVCRAKDAKNRRGLTRLSRLIATEGRACARARQTARDSSNEFANNRRSGIHRALKFVFRPRKTRGAAARPAAATGCKPLADAGAEGVLLCDHLFGHRRRIPRMGAAARCSPNATRPAAIGDSKACNLIAESGPVR